MNDPNDGESDMSLEQLTQAVYGLREELASVRHGIAEIKSAMPDWLKNGNMYPPGLLQSLGIPVQHTVHPDNRATKETD